MRRGGRAAFFRGRGGVAEGCAREGVAAIGGVQWWSQSGTERAPLRLDHSEGWVAAAGRPLSNSLRLGENRTRR